MLNYFNYFTEIEQKFQQRRGSLLMLSTLDWALVETWRDSDIPLEAVLRGIDLAFDRHDLKKHTARTRKVNGLAWCAQAVQEAAENAREAAVGTQSSHALEPARTGFEAGPLAAYLSENADAIARADLPIGALSIAKLVATRLQELAADSLPPLEDLDRILIVLEEKVTAALQLAVPEDHLVRIREQADRELSPYRVKMQALQIRQVQRQLLQKRLFELYRLPRLSLFYMRHA